MAGRVDVEPITGLAAIRGAIEGFLSQADEVDWVLIDVAESPDGRVLTERSDRFLIRDRWRECPITGVFEVDGAGKITSWRDYFDMKQFGEVLAP